MSIKYTIPTVEAIMEDPEDGSKQESMEDTVPEYGTSRDQQPSLDSRSTKTYHSEGRRKRSKKHKPTADATLVGQSRSDNGRRRHSSEYATRGRASEEQRSSRLKRSNSGSGSGSSSDAEETSPARRDVAAARSKLTSPSLISNLTCLTTSTNKSSGSSGSNSTVTQLSVSKDPNHRRRKEIAEPTKKEEVEKAPLSPPVPDAPNVFAFLESEPSPGSGLECSEGSQPVGESYQNNQLVRCIASPMQSLPDHTSTSSGSSSFRGDDTFSDHQQIESDRGTSPDISEPIEDDLNGTSTDQASAKLATQMAAAERWQNKYSASQLYGTPDMQRGNAELPHIPPTELTNRYTNHVKQHSLPRGEKLPVTGYELLASRLSTSTDINSPPRIKPLYRKFEALNHRLLLHLQDEISELEEQLHHLDNADTQSRRVTGHIVPASRRGAAQAGGELQWHKTDILGRIGFKLTQYSRCLFCLLYQFPTNAIRPNTYLLPLHTCASTSYALRRISLQSLPFHPSTNYGSRDSFLRPFR